MKPFDAVPPDTNDPFLPRCLLRYRVVPSSEVDGLLSSCEQRGRVEELTEPIRYRMALQIIMSSNHPKGGHNNVFG